MKSHQAYTQCSSPKESKGGKLNWVNNTKIRNHILKMLTILLVIIYYYFCLAALKVNLIWGYGIPSRRQSKSNLKSQQRFFFFKAHRLLSRRAETYSMRVGAIGPKLDGHGTEDAELACHLVHPAQGAFLISVCKFDHQAG